MAFYVPDWFLGGDMYYSGRDALLLQEEEMALGTIKI